MNVWSVSFHEISSAHQSNLPLSIPQRWIDYSEGFWLASLKSRFYWVGRKTVCIPLIFAVSFPAMAAAFRLDHEGGRSIWGLFSREMEEGEVSWLLKKSRIFSKLKVAEPPTGLMKKAVSKFLQNSSISLEKSFIDGSSWQDDREQIIYVGYFCREKVTWVGSFKTPFLCFEGQTCQTTCQARFQQ